MMVSGKKVQKDDFVTKGEEEGYSWSLTQYKGLGDPFRIQANEFICFGSKQRSEKNKLWQFTQS